MLLRSNEARNEAGTFRGIRYPSCLWARMCRNANAASFDIVADADGLIRFHAERTSVSGTSSEAYNGVSELTLLGQHLRG